MALVLRSAPRQLCPPFDDRPVWDAPSLDAALRREAGRSVQLTLTEYRSVLFSFRQAAREKGEFGLTQYPQLIKRCRRVA